MQQKNQQNEEIKKLQGSNGIMSLLQNISNNIQLKLTLFNIMGLSLTWSLGFILFNASTSIQGMSPSSVNLIRCLEPLASLGIGILVRGDAFSPEVVLTLVPVCGGVILASYMREGGNGGTYMSTWGVVLAMISNVCFSCRPYFTQRLQTNYTKSKKKGGTMDDVVVFFYVSIIASTFIFPFVLCIEGSYIHASFVSYSSSSYGSDVLKSSLTFAIYQFSQLKVMSSLNPLSFSVLTPVIKAFMIVACSLCFGEPLSFAILVGVGMTTGGGYLFSRAVRREKERLVKKLSVLPT